MFYNVIVQTMSKYMIVSKKMCESWISDLVGLIGSSLDPRIQINIIVAIGDLVKKYPFIVES